MNWRRWIPVAVLVTVFSILMMRRDLLDDLGKQGLASLAVAFYLSVYPVMLRALSMTLAERVVTTGRNRMDAWE